MATSPDTSDRVGHGDLVGAPLHGARATLLSVRLPRKTAPEAVRAAAAAAMAQAMAAGAPKLLEPRMRLGRVKGAAWAATGPPKKHHCPPKQPITAVSRLRSAPIVWVVALPRRLELSTPEAHLGAVMADLTGVRHGAVQQLLPPRAAADSRHTLLAQAPPASPPGLGVGSAVPHLAHALPMPPSA